MSKQISDIDEPGDFSPKEAIFQTGRAIFWSGIRALNLAGERPIQEHKRDQIVEPDEYPDCPLCDSSSEESTEVFIAKDGSRIVECDVCGLWRTCPRIDEGRWVEYLKQDTERSREHTYNRLKYGRSLPRNTKISFPGWFKRTLSTRDKIIDRLENGSDIEINRLHDVGCGVGFTLMAAERRGITASGNDLNKPACDAMDHLGLTAYNSRAPECPIDFESLDAVVMRDFIEHTYHPDKDIEAAFDWLRPGGTLYLETFHRNCRPAVENGSDWFMFYWTHTHHFTLQHLVELAKQAGFNTWTAHAEFDTPTLRIVAKKPQ